MQKMTTPFNLSSQNPTEPRVLNNHRMEPSEATLRLIMQFASNYRVQKCGSQIQLAVNLS